MHGSPNAPSRRCRVLGHTPIIVVCSLIGACSGKGDTVVITRQGPDGTIQTATVPRELTPKEGQKLLREIQANPKRMQKLTQPEKRFLARAAAAKAEREDEKDAGR